MEYGEVADEHAPLFETENSDRAFEEEVLFTGFGTAPTKGEGAAVAYDDAQESYTSRYTHETVALAFAVTEEAMEDNLYDTLQSFVLVVWLVLWQTLSRLKLLTCLTMALTLRMQVVMVSRSSQHHTQQLVHGNQSNDLGATDLSEASLESALITISKAKDDRGILIGLQASVLAHSIRLGIYC